jgi:hypothetical protein
MGVILIDSCIVTDLSDPDSAWFEWSASTLEQLDQDNTMVINPIIYAECSIDFERIEEVETLFEHLGFAISRSRERPCSSLPNWFLICISHTLAMLRKISLSMFS